MSFIIFSTRMSLFITVLAYVLSGFKITAEKVFMITAYYNILRTTMTVFFPQGVYTSCLLIARHVQLTNGHCYCRRRRRRVARSRTALQTFPSLFSFSFFYSFLLPSFLLLFFLIYTFLLFSFFIFFFLCFFIYTLFFLLLFSFLFWINSLHNYYAQLNSLKIFAELFHIYSALSIYMS